MTRITVLARVKHDYLQVGKKQGKGRDGLHLEGEQGQRSFLALLLVILLFNFHRRCKVVHYAEQDKSEPELD